LLGTCNYRELTPKGRDEMGPNYNLTDWVRHHDWCDDGGLVDPTGRYVPFSRAAATGSRARR
jgi:hypothetical protein